LHFQTLSLFQLRHVIAVRGGGILLVSTSSLLIAP
jgi:hypothetical protein